MRGPLCVLARWVPFAVALTCAALTTGCETFQSNVCDRTEASNPPVHYTGGTVTDGIYMSSPWTGELLHFPGGKHYDLEHKLGHVPSLVEAYLAFDESGTTDGGELAQASGNEVVFLNKDASIVEVKNDSCVDFWLLVVAQ